MTKHEPFRSRVYTERPAYADFDAPRKFMAIESIIARRLIEHPHAMCSYSGGSDSDILIDLIERVRNLFSLPPVDYAFFNTGLEMEATKRHVREVGDVYGVEIRGMQAKDQHRSRHAGVWPSVCLQDHECRIGVRAAKGNPAFDCG